MVTSLDSGLSVLRDLLYGRMHFDVEQIVGTDSMLIPLSESKTQLATKVQIEIFQVVESTGGGPGAAICQFRPTGIWIG